VLEEIAVQSFQRWIRASEQPIVGGVDWFAMRNAVLKLLPARTPALTLFHANQAPACVYRFALTGSAGRAGRGRAACLATPQPCSTHAGGVQQLSANFTGGSSYLPLCIHKSLFLLSSTVMACSVLKARSVLGVTHGLLRIDRDETEIGERIK
jgi:hypothetical protein